MYKDSRFHRPAILPAVLLAITVMTASSAEATTRHVPEDFSTIQPALDASAPGDTVLVAPGTYTGPGNIDLRYGRDLVLRSTGGPAVTIIDVQWAYNVAFMFWANETRAAVLDGFDIRNASEDFFGGINCLWASPTITNCIVEGCNPGILSSGESPLVRDCVIKGNNGQGGIAIQNGGSPEFEHCDISNNLCDGVLGGDQPIFRDCIVSGNLGFGMILITPGAQVLNCQICGNVRGGIAIRVAHVVGCTIAANGGTGLWSDENSHVERSIIFLNCGTQGSDIGVQGQLTMTCCAWPDSGVYSQHGGYITEDGPQVHTDPQFCAPAPCATPGHPQPGGDYRLRSDSPCLAQFSPCQEQIGYFDQGCLAPAPVGACCIGTGCLLVTAQQCATMLGDYHGDGESCYPNPCEPIPVQNTTWGRIKTLYQGGR